MADSPSPLPPYSNVWTKRAVDADEWLRRESVIECFIACENGLTAG